MLLQRASKRPALRAISGFCEQLLHLYPIDASRVLCWITEEPKESSGQEGVGVAFNC